MEANKDILDMAHVCIIRINSLNIVNKASKDEKETNKVRHGLL